MSKNKLIALAIAAVLASPAAYAVDVELTPADGDVIPTNAITDEDQEITVASTIDIVADATDNYLGRTTGYSVRVTLGGGATFAEAFDPNDVGVVGDTQSVTVAGGGGVGQNSITFSVTPSATGVTEGDGISIDDDGLLIAGIVVDNAEFMADGTPLTIDVSVIDPVGGAELASNDGTAVASAIEGWEGEIGEGDDDIRIDVGISSGKKEFSSDGSIDLADTLYFNAGTVDAALATLTDDMGLDESIATVAIVITGDDFAAFEDTDTADGSITLQSTAACDFSGTSFDFTVNDAQTTATLEDGVTVDDVQANSNICFEANGEVVIEDQDLSATMVISQDTFEDSPTFSGDLTSLQYNGSVARVMFFNPMSNVDQQSYLRISNTSTTDGLVTIDGVCDDGTATNSAWFTLPKGQSRLLTSQDVQQGNITKGITGSTGTCDADNATGVTGKMRLTVTGEMGSMEVQNFLRNGTSAGSINTNVNNDDN